jgi:hypothetical protein
MAERGVRTSEPGGKVNCSLAGVNKYMCCQHMVRHVGRPPGHFWGAHTAASRTGGAVRAQLDRLAGGAQSRMGLYARALAFAEVWSWSKLRLRVHLVNGNVSLSTRCQQTMCGRGCAFIQI